MDMQVLQRQVCWEATQTAVHIAGEKFAADKSMNVLECVPPAFVKEGDKLVQNTEGSPVLSRCGRHTGMCIPTLGTGCQRSGPRSW